MEVERRSESPSARTRSSSRLSTSSNQENSESEGVFLDAIKKKSRLPPKKKGVENGVQHEQNGKTEAEENLHDTTDIDSRINSNNVNTEEETLIVVEVDEGGLKDRLNDNEEIIDVEINEADDLLDIETPVDDSYRVEIKEPEDEKCEQAKECSGAKQADITENGIEEVEVEEDEEVSNNVESRQINGETNQNDAEKDSEERSFADEENDVADLHESTEPEQQINTSFTYKITNFLGKLSPGRREDTGSAKEASGSSYYPRITGRPGLKSGTPDPSLPGSSKDQIKTPNLTRVLNDSFGVKSEPPRTSRSASVESQNLKKYQAKRCLNADDPEENEEGFLSRLSFRKRRKVDDSPSGPGFFESVLRSPFKKRKVADVPPAETTPPDSKSSWWLTPFWFGKRKEEISQEATEEDKSDDAPQETTGCYLM